MYHIGAECKLSGRNVTLLIEQNVLEDAVGSRDISGTVRGVRMFGSAPLLNGEAVNSACESGTGCSREGGSGSLTKRVTPGTVTEDLKRGGRCPTQNLRSRPFRIRECRGWNDRAIEGRGTLRGNLLCSVP